MVVTLLLDSRQKNKTDAVRIIYIYTVKIHIHTYIQKDQRGRWCKWKWLQIQMLKQETNQVADSSVPTKQTNWGLSTSPDLHHTFQFTLQIFLSASDLYVCERTNVIQRGIRFLGLFQLWLNYNIFFLLLQIDCLVNIFDY